MSTTLYFNDFLRIFEDPEQTQTRQEIKLKLGIAKIAALALAAIFSAYAFHALATNDVFSFLFWGTSAVFSFDTSKVLGNLANTVSNVLNFNFFKVLPPENQTLHLLHGTIAFKPIWESVVIH